MKKQLEEKEYTFVNKISGESATIILPKYGVSNHFVRWHKASWGGSWIYCPFEKKSQKRYERGKNPSGLLGRMNSLLSWQRRMAKKLNYLPPLINGEDLLLRWQQQDNKCAACLGTFKDIFATRLDHNHRTGKVRGFIHNDCNFIEGHIRRMTDSQFKNFVQFINKIREDDSNEYERSAAGS